MTFKRAFVSTLLQRFTEKRKFIQVIAGPRQTGKTTAAMQVQVGCKIPVRFVSADDTGSHSPLWLAQQWEISRSSTPKSGALLIIDEVQKIPAWSESVKRLWDEDTRNSIPLKVLLLGSSPWLLQKGLTESLAGRFELHRSTHWSYPEMKDAFQWTLEQYLFFGGYPGAVDLIHDLDRWRSYVQQSLIETTLAKDILLLTRIDKPVLLRHLFSLACEYSGQILSYQKMIGQLQDAGNTTTLAHYLDLLETAGMVAGISKYAIAGTRQRGSSPKLLTLNNGLLNAVSGLTFAEGMDDPNRRGRIVENAIGAHLLNTVPSDVRVFYWRERNKEVDFVLAKGKALVALEVKSGKKKQVLPGLSEFSSAFKNVRPLLVGSDGIPIAEFLSKPASYWMG
jgi:predicted AAA+ superfamily ATPase